MVDTYLRRLAAVLLLCCGGNLDLSDMFVPDFVGLLG